jgi:hypothetical protein
MVLSFLAFAFILTLFLSFWYNGIYASNQAVVRNKMEYEMIAISDLLVESPGVPYYWESNTSNISALGLAREPNVLHPPKLSNFTNLSYGTLKSQLGLSHEFYFYVQDTNGNRLYETGNASSGTTSSVVVYRYALLNGQIVKLGLVAHD